MSRRRGATSALGPAQPSSWRWRLRIERSTIRAITARISGTTRFTMDGAADPQQIDGLGGSGVVRCRVSRTRVARSSARRRRRGRPPGPGLRRHRRRPQGPWPTRQGPTRQGPTQCRWRPVNQPGSRQKLQALQTPYRSPREQCPPLRRQRPHCRRPLRSDLLARRQRPHCRRQRRRPSLPSQGRNPHRRPRRRPPRASTTDSRRTDRESCSRPRPSPHGRTAPAGR